jgi:hypothetical protein
MARPRTQWDPAAFFEWFEKLPIEKVEQAWSDLKPAWQKLYVEWKTFRAFAKASDLDIDPRSIETCDPSADADSPPLPDIRCLMSGEP